jgi:hypothetical protein
VVVGDDVAVRGDDRAAARTLDVDLAAVAIIDDDDRDADEAGIDRVDGAVDHRPVRRLRGGGDHGQRNEKQGQQQSGHATLLTKGDGPVKAGAA